MYTLKHLLLLFFFTPSIFLAQKTTILKGIIRNTNGDLIKNVSIKFDNTGTITDEKGSYSIRIPLNKEISVEFTHISYQPISKTFFVKNRNIIRFSPILTSKTEKLEEITIQNNNKNARGIIKIDTEKAKNLLGANAGVENVLMTLPGVNNNNELSTQYNVRGGNFDENLVYVNGIEVYRPFLIRSGQQEGLSFINSNMVKNIDFSAGGFQAKYGDKLSSVLDITYKKPKEKTTTIDASLLGASATFEGEFLDKKLSAISGIRYRNNSLFVNSKQIETNFQPIFTDVQTFLSYNINNSFKLNFLGNFSLNNYNNEPISRRTRFGTVANPIELTVFYEGQETNTYLTTFGAFSLDFKPNNKFNLTSVLSRYNTQEEEYYDISASYRLGEVESNIGNENFGEVEFTQGIGSQLNHARNDLDAVFTNAQIKGSYKITKEKILDFGIKYQNEDVRDRIREWEMIDSLGFSIRPPGSLNNNQPYEAFEGPIVPFQNIRTENEVIVNRFSAYTQFSERFFWKEHEVWYNLGLRAHNWSVQANNGNSKNQTIVSPRAQFAVKPNWQADMLFRFSSGLYAQPPSYRELRDFNGNVNVNVKAQKSIHYVLGMDYSFDLWERPFKLTTEVYYKNLTDVNSYTIDNVRIRYRADNVTTAYAQGLDVRLNGEFVPGSESWVSLGYLKTEENINNRGYISRPSDQRFKLGILFQDYVPSLPDLKAYLNLVYNSGVPGGSPAYSDPYDFQNRLRPYRRADIGVSYIIVGNKKRYKNGWKSNFKQLNAGLELFNMFDIQNSITNTWVRDVFSRTQFGIPNFMTQRVLNFKLAMKF